MRLSKRRRGAIVGMNMTPMIDIVFLLIIFFMTVTQVSEINKERLLLPHLKGGEEQVTATVTINVDEQGRIVISGRPYSLVDLVGIVADEIALLDNDPTRLRAVVRADRNGASRTVNQIVSALGKLGVAKIRVAVEIEQT